MNRIIRFWAFWLLYLVPMTNIIGQSIELETLPATTKWSQIKSNNFNIIFPNGFEKEANRTANILETIHTPASQSLGVKPRKFSVILQNQNAIANGFVTIGPRRSEFFTTSTQDYKFLGNTDWLEFLAVHEFRHMVQFEKAYQTPINKLMYWAFGEYGLGFASAIAAPNWFWEGDAVGVETSFTKTGRGRTPNFELQFKTNLLEKGGFNYSKQHLGSFRDFVPNHYRTGYFMTTHFKRKYGVDIWDKIISRSFSFPYIPFVFSNAIKKETGKNLSENYADMLGEMRERYKRQIESLATDSFTRLNVRKDRVYTDYHYPHQDKNGHIIVLKSGFSHTDQFVKIDEKGNENELFTTGIMNDPGFLSIGDDKIVWTEFEFDPRWLKKTYSVIKSYDISTNAFRKITRKSKYVSAAVSHDGKLIAAVENSTENKYSIHILDFHTGDIIKKFTNEDNDYYSMPSFSQDTKSLVLLKSTKDKKNIVLKDMDSGDEETILSSELENLGHPVLAGDYLYYNSPVNGIANIYACKMDSKEIYQVTRSKYGAYNPSLSSDGNLLLYNEFTKDGMDAVSMVIDPESWTPVSQVQDRNIKFAEPMVQAEGHSHVLDHQQKKNYEISPYKKLKHTIRPHSWGLSAIPTNNSMILGLNSQDILSTTTISAGLRFDSDEGNWLKFGSISYQGLYPIIDLSIVDGTRSSSFVVNGTSQKFNWEETSIEAGLRIPLVLTNSKYLRKLTLSSSSTFTSVSGYDVPEERIVIDQPGNGNLKSLEHGIRFNNMLRRSKLDLHSRFGQSLAVHYFHTPLGGDYRGSLFAAEANLFFPGIARHHSIRARGSFQHENSQNYFFDSPITFTRGFGYFPFRDFTNYSLNYKLPLWYPDIQVGPLLNIQRIYVNGFLDRGLGSTQNQPDFNLNSYGAEMSFNFNLMRFSLLFDMGIRYTYMPDFNDNRVELIIGGVSF